MRSLTRLLSFEPRRGAGGAPALTFAIPGFELEERLTQRGEVSVYRARRRSDGELARLTILRMVDAPEDGERQARFLEDGERLLGLEEPHLLASYDLSEDGETACWLVQEHLDAPDLAQVLEANPGPLSLELSLAIGIQLGQALASMDRVDLVHRDLTLGHVLLGLDGKVRLVGFGLNVESSYDRLSAGQAPLSSVDFLSPEQVDGDLPPTTRTDVYGLGALLFRCLSGKTPHAGATLFTRLRAIAHDMPPDLRALAPGVSDGLAELVSRCLEWDADDRPLPRDLAPLLRREAEALGQSGAWEEKVVAAAARAHKERSGPAPQEATVLRLLGTDRALERRLSPDKEIEVGRSGDASVPLRFPWVSRRHATLGIEDGALILTDLRSANGTTHNRDRLEGRIEVKDGDTIGFGKSHFEVTLLKGSELPQAKPCQLCDLELDGQELEGRVARVRCREQLEADRAAGEERVEAALKAARFEISERRRSLGLFRRYRAKRRKKTFLVSAIELGQRAAKRFAEASQPALLLKHHSLLPVLDIDVREGTLLVVCEDHPGETLTARVEASGSLPPREVATMGRRLADVLDYALGEGVAGFVRPDLILLDEHLEPRILDLGLSPGLVEAARTLPGRCLRPTYLPPEARDISALTPSGVVYGLGATLVYALTGHGTAEVRAGERYDYLPAKFSPNLPRRLAALLSSCTALDPEARPGAPGAVMLDFEGLVLDTAPSAEDLGPDENTRPPAP